MLAIIQTTYLLSVSYVSFLITVIKMLNQQLLFNYLLNLSTIIIPFLSNCFSFVKLISTGKVEKSLVSNLSKSLKNFQNKVQ